jgi:hypothetical protein
LSVARQTDQLLNNFEQHLAEGQITEDGIGNTNSSSSSSAGVGESGEVPAVQQEQGERQQSKEMKIKVQLAASMLGSGW